VANDIEPTYRHPYEPSVHRNNQRVNINITRVKTSGIKFVKTLKGERCNKNDKYQLTLMNPRDALHHGKRAANKGGRSV